jgi:hypothetical protein
MWLKKSLITGAAVAALGATALGAVQVTAPGVRVVCLPPAVIQAWS